MIYSILYTVLVSYLCYALILVPIAGVYQEYKVSAPHQIPSLTLLGILKAYGLFFFWVSFSFIGTLPLIPKYVLFGCLSQSVERTVCLVERITGIMLAGMFVGPVQVRGRENLPPSNPSGKGVLYIANHSSSVDASVVYFLFRTFKWVAKKSTVYMPGVGAIMVMGGHIIIDRKSKNSKNKLYEKSHSVLNSGESIFLFPQGTRCLSKWLPFRDGAFNLALEGGYQIVPVSIELPKAHYNSWYPINLLWRAKNDPVVITVHPVVDVKKSVGKVNIEEKNKLKKECEEIMLSALPHFRKLIETN